MQTYKKWQLIIIDDCSDNKTLNLLKKFHKHKKIKIYYQKKNYGAGFCRNLAMKKSKSPYIAFIDSDDIWNKNKLEKLYEKKSLFFFIYILQNFWSEKKIYNTTSKI
jgi:glycosyltransferase involved in cell wall biosynthesis